MIHPSHIQLLENREKKYDQIPLLSFIFSQGFPCLILKSDIIGWLILDEQLDHKYFIF